MKLLLGFLGPIGVAGALLTSAVALAQVKKAAADRKEPEKKQAEAKRDDSKKSTTKTAGVVKDAVAPAAEAAKEDLDPLIQQFKPQIRPLYWSQLIYIRGVCPLSKEQMQRIRPEADQIFTDVVKRYAQLQNKMMRGGWNASENLEPQKLLQDGLSDLVKKHVSPEQWARYQADLKKRDARRKRAGLEYLVALLDRELVLSDDQRGRLTDSLSSHWDASWSSALDLNLYGNQFLPSVPDRFVTPFLNDVQKKVWRELPKYGNFFWGGAMNNIEDPAIDAELGLVPAAEPKKEEPKKQPADHPAMKKAAGTT